MQVSIVESTPRVDSSRRRIVRTGLFALGAVLALGAVSTARAAVIPLVDSVILNPSTGELTATFGYISTSANAVIVSLGVDNFTTPAPFFRPGQPSSFYPGTHHEVWSATWDPASDPTLTWTVQGVSAPANSSMATTAFTSEFSYQGRLENAGVPYAGTADFRFTLYTTPAGSTTVGSPVAKSGVAVAGGLFTVALDFGMSAFDTSTLRYLETEVRVPAWDGQGAEPPFTTLSPRTPLTPTPMAIGAAATRPSNLYIPGSTTTSLATGSSGFLFVGPSASAAFTHPIEVGTDSSDGNGAYLTAGGVWTNGSDRNSKTDFIPVDARTILDKVAALPVTEWRYKGEADGVRHIGPMAQDFKAAFGLGHDERHIGTVDADGVALVAIKALNEKTRGLEADAERLRRENEVLRARLDSIETALRNGAVKP